MSGYKAGFYSSALYQNILFVALLNPSSIIGMLNV